MVRIYLWVVQPTTVKVDSLQDSLGLILISSCAAWEVGSTEWPAGPEPCNEWLVPGALGYPNAWQGAVQRLFLLYIWDNRLLAM